jgi:tetraacyldisaccharide 4'-kinase
VDAVVLTERRAGDLPRVAPCGPFVATARLRLGDAVNLANGERRPLDAFRGATVQAVAGIGHPEAFFDGLRAAGLGIAPHALGDHAALDPAALPFPANSTVLMTEKDAVKCRGFAGADWWFVELVVGVDRADAGALLALILERTGLAGAGVPLG